MFPISQLLIRKDGDDDPSQMVDPEAHAYLSTLSNLNAAAESVYELYPNPSPFVEPESVWKEIGVSPSRIHSQKELRSAIQKLESSRSILDETVQ